jgi:hypothetical protein
MTTTTTTIPIPPADPLAAARARKRAERQEQVRHELEARVLNQRWPVPRALRGEIVNVALRLCGLEITDDGQVKPTGARPQPPRVRLAALRVLASFDKLSIDQRKLDLKQYPPTGVKPLPESKEPSPQISPEVATECLMMMIDSYKPPPKPAPGAKPEPPPERDLTAELSDTRWPIAKGMRAALIEIAAGLCGLSAACKGTGDDTSEPDDSPQTTRIVVGALRVFARFDRLSLEHRRVELHYRSPAVDPRRPQLTPKVVARIQELMEEEENRQLEREIAAEEAARAGPDGDGAQ